MTIFKRVTAAKEFPKEKVKPLFEDLSGINLKYQQLRTALADLGTLTTIRSEEMEGWLRRLEGQNSIKYDLDVLAGRVKDLIKKARKIGI